MRKTAGILFFLKLLKIPINIYILSLTAKYFGVTFNRDLWLLSFTAMMALDLAIWGPINETFRVKFIIIKENQGEQRAIYLTQSLLFYIFAISVIIVGFIILFSDSIANLLAPEYSVIQHIKLIEMLMYVAPVLLVNQIMQIGISILNAYEIFYVPEISGFVTSILNVFLLIFLAPIIGIYALLVSYFITTVVLIFFILIYIKKKNIPIFKINWNIKFDGFKTFFLFAIPFFLPYFFGQINSVVEKSLSSTLGQGMVSILDYANKIPSMMSSLLVSIITTLLIPVLSKNFIQGNNFEYNEEFRKMFQLGFLIIGLIISTMMGAGEAIVKILYDNGNISQYDLNQVVIFSILYSWSLLGVFSYIIFGMSLLSSQNSKLYAILGMITQIIVVVLNFIFIKIVGAYIFPLSLFIAHGLTALLMARKYPFKNNSLNIVVLKYLSLVLVMSFLLFLLKDYILIDNYYIKIVIVVIIEFLLLLALVFIFKMDEKNLILQKIKKYL